MKETEKKYLLRCKSQHKKKPCLHFWTSPEEYGSNVCPRCKSAFWRGRGSKRVRAPSLSELYALWEDRESEKVIEMIEKLIVKYENGEYLPDNFDQGAATGVVLGDLNALLKSFKEQPRKVEKVV